MRLRPLSTVFVLASMAAAQAAHGQGNYQAPTRATVRTEPVTLTYPDRYQVPVVLEPARRVSLVAQHDGVLRGVSVAYGANVTAGQEVATFDKAEALAKQRVAQSEVRQAQAEADAMKAEFAASKVAKLSLDQATAKLEGATARAEIAQLEVDRCTLKAPFAGRILGVTNAIGQFLTKGALVADVVDSTKLYALIPVDRSAATAGGNLELTIEGRQAASKVEAIVPLPAPFASLRELATPWAGAWVSIANPTNAHEPGQRVRNPFLPNAPITALAGGAIRPAAGGAAVVQVIRAEYAVDVPVKVLGNVGPDRTQVSGPFQLNDLIVLESTVRLDPGTFVRFSNFANPSADIVSPIGGAPAAGPPRVAPIGGGGVAGPPPATVAPPAVRPVAPTPKPAAPARGAAGAVPF